MKKVEAIVRTSKLAEVEQALHLHGVDGLTITEVRGRGSERGPTIAYWGVENAATVVPRFKVETLVDDDHVEEVVDALYGAAHTGESGDGRIVVLDVACAVQIRTGETHRALESAR